MPVHARKAYTAHVYTYMQYFTYPGSFSYLYITVFDHVLAKFYTKNSTLDPTGTVDSCLSGPQLSGCSDVSRTACPWVLINAHHTLAQSTSTHWLVPGSERRQIMLFVQYKAKLALLDHQITIPKTLPWVFVLT